MDPKITVVARNGHFGRSSSGSALVHNLLFSESRDLYGGVAQNKVILCGIPCPPHRILLFQSLELFSFDPVLWVFLSPYWRTLRLGIAQWPFSAWPHLVCQLLPLSPLFSWPTIKRHASTSFRHSFSLPHPTSKNMQSLFVIRSHHFGLHPCPVASPLFALALVP